MSLFGQKHRFTEKIIPLNQELYVLGTATPTKEKYEKATEQGVVKKGKNNKTLIISDMSEKEITKDWRVWVPLLIGGIGIITTISLLIMSLLGSLGLGIKPTFVILIFLGVSLGFFYHGFKELQQQQLMESIPTSEIDSMAMGLVEIKGKTKAMKEPLKSPFTGTKCIGYKCKIEKLVQRDKHSDWETLKEFREFPIFYVKDKTGVLPVNPRGADFMLSTHFKKKTTELKDLPQPAQEYLKNNKVKGLNLD